MARTGRPKAPSPRDKIVKVRLTKEEEVTLRELSNELGMTISETIRYLVYNETLKR